VQTSSIPWGASPGNRPSLFLKLAQSLDRVFSIGILQRILSPGEPIHEFFVTRLSFAAIRLKAKDLYLILLLKTR
jgi:hypothetical protein